VAVGHYSLCCKL